MPVTDLRVGTFNIRNSGAKDGKNAWPNRRAIVVDTIRRAGPDIVGFQEVLPDQQKALAEDLNEYASVATFRDDGKAKGEASSVFYRKNRFEQLDSGSFWLCQTPDVPGSFGWDAVCTRLCTWVRLKDRKSGKTVLAANTHFDHVGKTAQLESAKLIVDRLAKNADGAAVVLTGDFNATETGRVYSELFALAKVHGLPLTDTYRAAHPQRQPNEASFHGFKDTTDGERIDWIFCNDRLKTIDSTIDHSKSADGRYPSDHYPIWATLQYAK